MWNYLSNDPKCSFWLRLYPRLGIFLFICLSPGNKNIEFIKDVVISHFLFHSHTAGYWSRKWIWLLWRSSKCYILTTHMFVQQIWICVGWKKTKGGDINNSETVQISFYWAHLCRSSRLKTMVRKTTTAKDTSTAIKVTTDTAMGKGWTQYHISPSRRHDR